MPVTVLVEMHDAPPENPDYVTHLTHWPTEAQISVPDLGFETLDRGPSRSARTFSERFVICPSSRTSLRDFAVVLATLRQPEAPRASNAPERVPSRSGPRSAQTIQTFGSPVPTRFTETWVGGRRTTAHRRTVRWLHPNPIPAHRRGSLEPRPSPHAPRPTPAAAAGARHRGGTPPA